MRPAIPFTLTAFLAGCSTFQAQKQDPPQAANQALLAAPPSQRPDQSPMPVSYSPQMPYSSSAPYPTLSVCNPGGELSPVCGTCPTAPPTNAIVELQQGEDGNSTVSPPAPGGCAGNGAIVGVSALAFIPIGGSWGSSGGNSPILAPATKVEGVKGGIESLGKIMESVNSTGLHGQLESALGHTSNQNGPIFPLFTEKHTNELAPRFETEVHTGSSSPSSEASAHESSTSTKK